MLLSMPGNEALAASIAGAAPFAIGAAETRRFPDGETLLRVPETVRGRDVDIVCTLVDPDRQFLGLAFAAMTARDLGARSVNLVAPYLAYMRQDARFNPGEAISARCFAQQLSGLFDRLVTVDPHLHRIARLEEIFTIPVTVLHAAPLLGEWVRANVVRPLLIGPDSESAQWVAAVAAHAGAPHIVLDKERLGDRNVAIAVPDVGRWQGHAPVLVDDMISSGRTMIEAAAQIVAQGLARPVCMTVHPIFAEGSYPQLLAVSRDVISTDSIPHASNRLTVAPLLAAGIAGNP